MLEGGKGFLGGVAKAVKTAGKVMVIFAKLHPMLTVGGVATSVGAVAVIISRKQMMAAFMVLIAASNQVLFTDETYYESVSSCAWAIREEGTTAVGSVVSTDTYTTGGSLLGNTNEEQIWWYLLGKGLTKEQVAGLMGNFQAESGFIFNNCQNGSYNGSLGKTEEDTAYTQAVDDGTYTKFTSDSIGYGLAQWTTSGRKTNLYKLKQERGVSIADPLLQLDYLWQELETSYKTSVLDATAGVSTPEEAAIIVLKKFEAPKNQGTAVQQIRGSNARTIYDKYKDKTAPTVGTSTITGTVSSGYADTQGTPSGLWPTLLTDVAKHEGEWTKLKDDVGKAPASGDKETLTIDKFKSYNTVGICRYSQNLSGGTTSVSTYSTLTYNLGSVLNYSGCGVCAAAIVFSTLSGKTVNPAEVALAGMTYDDRNSGKSYSDIYSGNGANVITETGICLLASEAGFQAELKEVSKENIDECLSKDGMIIADFEREGVFSSGGSGHYMVIREVSGEKYYVVQSADFNCDDVGYDFDYLKDSIKHTEAVYVYPKLDTSATSTGTSTQVGKKYILYHTGDEDCPKHNGFYCSCGLRRALDYRKEYVLYEAELAQIIDEVDSSGKSIPLVKEIGNIKAINQTDIGYPKGSEITSLAMLLNYLGIDIDVPKIDSKYLKKGDAGSTDPDIAFVGEPTDSSAYGCYAPVIVETANKILEANGSDLTAKDLTGTDFDTVLKYYVGDDMPVVIWVTTNNDSEPLQAPETGPTWTIGGKTITWQTNEHCVLLKGYDYTNNTVTVVDPLVGIVTRDMTLFKQRYEEMGQRAVAIPTSLASCTIAGMIPPMRAPGTTSSTWGDIRMDSPFYDAGATHNSNHGALDLNLANVSTSVRAEIVAVWDGKVVKTGYINNGYGNQVIIEHNIEGETVYTKYNHMKEITVSEGEIVKAGTQVGVEGGYSTTTKEVYSPHLDFQMAVKMDSSDKSVFLHNMINPLSVICGKVSKISECTVWSFVINTSHTCVSKGEDYAFASKDPTQSSVVVETLRG